MTPPLLNPNFGCVHQIARVGVRRSIKLVSRKIIFEVFQSMWSRNVNVTGGQTDRQTDGQST